MSREALLTGRELVKALEDFGVGHWTPDAVRQWIREDPACPIATPADQGKPHRYQLDDVLNWLRVRTLAERAKGYTRGDGNDLVERIDRALQGTLPVSSTDSAQKPKGDSEKIAANTLAPTGEGAATGVPASQGKQTDWLQLNDVDALLQVLQGRDPRNWKAAEEALTTRRERLEAERRLIPIEELESALGVHVHHTVRGLASAAPALKLSLRGLLKPDQIHSAEKIIDQQMNELLQRLAKADDLEPAPSPDAPGAHGA